MTNDWEVYEKHCKGEFSSIRADLSTIKKSIVGNGNPGLSTRVDRMENSWKIMVWFLSPLYVGGAGLLLKSFYDVLKNHL